jgi:TonB-linked SusC/RagA family outer membrane protein
LLFNWSSCLAIYLSKREPKTEHITKPSYQPMKRVLSSRLLRNLPAIFLLTVCYCSINAQSSPPPSKPKKENRETIALKQLLEELNKKRNMSFVWSGKNTLQANLPTSVLQENDQQIIATLEALLQKNGLKLTKSGERQYVISENKQDKVTNPTPKQTGQEFQITGIIRDPLAQPLSNVSITQLSTLKGTVSDSAGHFKIMAAKGDSIRFEHVGFTPQTVIFKDRIEFDIALEASVGGLNEVVVIGYGKQKRVSQVGAQSTVNVEELKQPVANLSNVIAGRLAGVVGVQRSGEPGYDNATIWIRGISTFTNSGPLVLVDGIERNFNYIDPEDISSFSILKDASATAVYGVRGANGVILIQTRKGKSGKPQVNIQYNQGITQFTKKPEFVDGPTYLKLANEAYASSNPNSPQLYSEERIKNTTEGNDPDLYPNVNWMEEMFNKYGQNRRANANVTGGSPNAKYYLSVGYYDEEGLFKTDELAQYNSSIKYKRFNFTSNLGLDITPTTKLDFGASGWISVGNFPGTGTSDIWNNVFLATPVSMPAIYNNGNAPVLRSNVTSPYIQLTKTGYVRENRNQLWSNIRLTQDLGFWLKGLSATAMYSFDAYNSLTIRRTKTVDGYIMTGRNADESPIFEQTRVGSNYLGYSRDNGGNRQFYTEASVNYTNKFGKHDVSGMLLFNRTDYENAFAGDFISSIPFRNQGWAGRATYGFDTRYLLEVNFGYNGAENFAPSKRYGFFPSFGLGWVVSNEAFFKPLSNTIDFLKFRGSWGKVGNNKISDSYRFGYIAQVGSGNGGYSYGRNNNNGYDGLDISEYAVDVSWEQATKTNIGIELKTLKNALSLTVDYFIEKRDGIFLRRSNMPNYVGLRNNPYGNFGIVHNKGVDGTIEYNKAINKSFSIGLRGNFTWNRAIIIDDANAPYPFPWQQRIGRKYGQRFGYTALGLFEDEKEILNSPLQTGTVKPGDIKFKDLNGDGRIDAYDQGPIGYGSVPELVYGFGTNITWKGFSIGAFFKGMGNVDISLNGEGFQPFQLGGDRGNLLTQVQDRWTPSNPNPNATYPRLTYPSSDNMNYENSSWWVKSGSFLRLQSLDASYSLPKRPWMNSAGLGSVRIFLTGYNVATFSSFKMWDVELGDGKGARYPLIKSFNVGLELRFK